MMLTVFRLPPISLSQSHPETGLVVRYIPGIKTSVLIRPSQ